jgi:hypothetical protein
MNSPAFTLKAWSIYVAITGLGLTLVPNLLLAPLGLPATQEIWVHVLGLVTVVLSFYYWASAAVDARSFFSATVYGRGLFFAGCIGLVLLAAAPWQVIIFGVIDLAGAAWTKVALGRDRQLT